MILTLNQQEFDRDCRELYRLVTDTGFQPDAIVAIARGGVYVTEAMQAPVPLFSITLQRSGTKAKASLTDRLLPKLPLFICDFLRVAESKAYGLLARLRPPHPMVLPDSMAPADLLEFMCKNPLNLLIVDDAVDSGATLLAVKDLLQRLAPWADIRTAVITQTRRRAVISPDIRLRDVGTIVRFPWATDNPIRR